MNEKGGNEKLHQDLVAIFALLLLIVVGVLIYLIHLRAEEQVQEMLEWHRRFR